jgi:hypothetical protein
MGELSAKQSNDKVAVVPGDLLEELTGQANIVVANITADVLLNLIEDLAPYMASEGVFIGSGVIDPYFEDIKDALTDKGFKLLEITGEEEWVAFAAIWRKTRCTGFFAAPDQFHEDRVYLSEEEVRHIKKVLRLESGAVVRVFDGQGHEYEVELMAGRGELWGRIMKEVPAVREPELKVTLAQGLAKGEKMS